MDKLIRETMEGKRVVLLGFGREGQSSYAAIRNVLPEQELTIADANTGVASHPVLQGDEHLHFLLGPDYLSRLADYDIVMKSPGITLKDLPFSLDRKRITSQTDLFLRRFGGQVAGITGTKGKSTTASLLYHILKNAGQDVVLLGNIGSPAFHFLGQVGPGTRVVFELSSHQLEYIERSPHIAILLNLFQEHLDAYRSYLDYQKAKMNIALFQGSGDYFIYNGDDPLVAEHLPSVNKGQALLAFSSSAECSQGAWIVEQDIRIATGDGPAMALRGIHNKYLRGDHNLRNIMAAATAAALLGVDETMITEGVETFKGLAHRMEYTGFYHGIHFYNDSIATIPEACMAAVRSIPEVDTLVAGGFDRGIDYAPLAVFLSGSSVRNVILLGAAGKRIGEEMEKVDIKGKQLFYINRFDDFLAPALKYTRPGYVCLLSPAAASYDEFRNFEERGRRYAELVRQAF